MKSRVFYAVMIWGTMAFFSIFFAGQLFNPIVRRGNFYLVTLSAGLLMATGMTFVLRRKVPTAYEERSDCLAVTIVTFGSFLLITPIAAGRLNKYFPYQSITCERCWVLDMSESPRYGKSGSKWYVYQAIVYVDGQEREFWVNADLYNRYPTGKYIGVCRQRGLLGYEFVTVFY